MSPSLLKYSNMMNHSLMYLTSLFRVSFPSQLIYSTIPDSATCSMFMLTSSCALFSNLFYSMATISGVMSCSMGMLMA